MRTIVSIFGALLFSVAQPAGLGHAAPAGPLSSAGIERGDSVGGSVVVSARVVGVRVIVLNHSGELLQVWSNSDESSELQGRLGSRHGPEIGLTPQALRAYQQVAPSIPKGAKGLVFQNHL